jgi:hypothetical protein
MQTKLIWLAPILNFKMAAFIILLDNITNNALSPFLDIEYIGVDTRIKSIHDCVYTEVWAKYDWIDDHFEIQDGCLHQVNQ